MKHNFSKRSLEERFFKNLYVFILGVCVVFIQSLIEEAKSDSGNDLFAYFVGNFAIFGSMYVAKL